jgi:hypothetical protein
MLLPLTSSAPPLRSSRRYIAGRVVTNIILDQGPTRSRLRI